MLLRLRCACRCMQRFARLPCSGLSVPQSVNLRPRLVPPLLSTRPAVVGPPRSHAGPFAWSRSGALAQRVPHVGQPDEFAYQFERMSHHPPWQGMRDAAPGQQQ